jgi:branched-chain amino acid transport system permease protein
MGLPCGTHNYTYAQDMAILRTKTHWALLIALFIFVFTAPLYWSNYWLSVFNLIGITVIAAIGLNILTGYCGQLSFGHVGFIAVGAYTSAVLTSVLGLPFLVGLIAGGVIAGLVGLIFAIPSLRVKGFYLVITTIAAQFIIIWVVKNLEFTGGSGGITVPHASMGGLVLASQTSQFYLIMVIVVLCTFFAKNLARTRVGRAFVAIRDNELAAEAMGINPFYHKLLAFFIGCFWAGIAGSLLAHWIGFISPENFTFTESLLYLGMIVIGGLGTALGPILGVIFIRLLQQGVVFLVPTMEASFSALPADSAGGIALMLFGLIIVLFLIFEPRGLAHRWMLLKTAYRLWPFSY